MWILKWLPFWIFYALLFLGLIGLAATYLMRFLPIPALFIYKTPIQLISVVLIVIGTFMTGAIWNEEAWLQKVKELEAKVAESEAKASKANVDIQEKIVYKDKVIVQKGEEIIKYVDKFVTKEVLKEVLKEVCNKEPRAGHSIEKDSGLRRCLQTGLRRRL